MEALTWEALKAILLAFGPKVTLCIVGLYAVFQVGKAVAGFFERMLASRDAMLSQTLRDVAEMNRQRASFEKETATILATIRADTAIQLAEARDTRKEMHQRFNKLQEDVTTIRGATS